MKVKRVLLRSTLTPQTLLCCRVLIESVLGFIIRAYKKSRFW